MANPGLVRPEPRVTRRGFLGAVGVGLAAGIVGCKPGRRRRSTSDRVVPFGVLAGRPTETSVTLSVLSFVGEPWFLEWGRDRNALDQRCETQAASPGPVEVLLAGLAPAERYYYRVRSARSGAGAADPTAGAVHGTVHTQRRPGDSFVFTLTSDSHLTVGSPRKEKSPFARAMSLVKSEAPDFHITLGDESMTHGRRYNATNQPQADAAYVNFREHYAEVARLAPVFFAVGNHEGEGWIGERFGFSRAMATCSKRARLAYVPNPRPQTYPQGGGPNGNYFAWTWGDALLIVVDPHSYSTTVPRRPEDWTLGPDQMSWLEGVLESSSQKWTILLQHQLVGGSPFGHRYGEWGLYSHYGRGGATLAHVGEQAAIHRLMTRHAGQIILKGHDHVYADERRDGIRYTTCGRLSGGQPEGPRWATEAGFRELYPEGFDGAWGYLRIAVSSQSVDVRFIGTDGETRGGYTVGQDRPA